ncbi:DDB1- and CUL4-associated factor 12-like [Branchiostoma lanceolatum]|uniref:DDB1- and CUL4-associated factor 12-like n=1 Tax=Branchiostoma lanceolatum TaxID=7740 RepID=UPI0034546F36
MSVFECIQRRQYGYGAPPADILMNYASRKMPLLFEEREYHLGTLNKVFAAQWLSENQVVCATKCNKLFVLDLKTGERVVIPSLQGASSANPSSVEHSGNHSVAINPSGTLLATGGKDPLTLAIYTLPSFDPRHLGQGCHNDWIFSIVWLDDKFLVTGSRDSSVAVWKIEESSQSEQHLVRKQPHSQTASDSHTEQLHSQTASDSSAEELHSETAADSSGVAVSCHLRAANSSTGQLHSQTAEDSSTGQLHRQTAEDSDVHLPSYSNIQSVVRKTCSLGEKVRAVVFNSRSEEVVGLTSNGYLNVWNVNGKRCKNGYLTSVGEVFSAAAPFARENTSLTLDPERGLFAVGSQSHVSFLDAATMKHVLNVPSKDKGTGVRSISFRGDVVTMGTGAGSLLFYDVRARRFLDCNCGMTLRLRSGDGWLKYDEMYHGFFSDQLHFPNAVYAHLYDPAGVRLFTAGGPLPAGLWGNYAALWS